MRSPKLTSLTAHVTELEMTAPPKQSLPMPVNIQTAILRVSDIPLSYYRFLYLRVGRRWHWTERLRMGDEDLAAVLADKRTSVTVLYVISALAINRIFAFVERRARIPGFIVAGSGAGGH